MSELYDGLRRLCQAHGTTTAQTYALLHAVEASLTEGDDESDPGTQVLVECAQEINRTRENLGDESFEVDYAADVTRALSAAYGL